MDEDVGGGGGYRLGGNETTSSLAVRVTSLQSCGCRCEADSVSNKLLTSSLRSFEYPGKLDMLKGTRCFFAHIAWSSTLTP